MASITNKNINYCVSCLVQGVQCPAERVGKPCPMAHTIGEVNPRKCNREEGGEECRCKCRKYPFVCQFIHDGETKEEYAKRLGFDPEHRKYDNCSYEEYESEYNECGKLVDELRLKIGKFDLSNIQEKDKTYVRRTQNSIHHLSLKHKWLLKNMKECEMEEDAVTRKNEAADRAAVDVRKMKNREEKITTSITHQVSEKNPTRVQSYYSGFDWKRVAWEDRHDKWEEQLRERDD